MNEIHAELVDGLRVGGHAVDFHQFGVDAEQCDELIEHAARFIDAALNVAGCPASGRAYVRVSTVRGLLFVEVTHLSPGTFDVLMGEPATLDALDEIRQWATRSGRSVTIERGPRDQFRAVVSLAQVAHASA
ncbi:MAG TPA: hypothetical protein VFW97_08410 [Acidimicrobiia bacterium]|nr:hypothetical protein [Acidimicrobiia bacterium]